MLNLTEIEMTDQLLESSGELPPLSLDDQLDAEPTTIFEDTPLRDGTFTLNPYRVAFLSIKSILFVLITVLNSASKRDFIRVFLFLLLIPIFAELVLDIYTEVKASFAGFASTPLNWDYYYSDYYSTHIRFLPGKALTIYEDILVHYSSYLIFRTLPIISILSYAFTDWLFWSLLWSSIVLLSFSFRAIFRPDQIPYIAFWPSFLKLQVLPLLLAGSDVLLSLLDSDHVLLIALSALVKIIGLVVAAALLLLLLISPFMLCRRVEETTKRSNYVFVRSAKSRLLWTALFLVFIHVFSVPYIAWAGLSTWKDLASLLSVDQGFFDSLATNAFVLHLSLLPIRSLLILLSSLLLLPPIRSTFVHFFCCCCRRR